MAHDPKWVILQHSITEEFVHHVSNIISEEYDADKVVHNMVCAIHEMEHNPELYRGNLYKDRKAEIDHDMRQNSEICGNFYNDITTKFITLLVSEYPTVDRKDMIYTIYYGLKTTWGPSSEDENEDHDGDEYDGPI